MRIHSIGPTVALLISLGSLDSAQPNSRRLVGPQLRAAVVHVLYDVRSPETAPFPSDHLTVPDDRQLTRRRVNLPSPSDCSANASDCNEVNLLNELDGFSTTPLLRIPFDGDIDPATVNSDSVFVVSLTDLSRHGINQVVWDPPTHMLHALTEEPLNEHAQYALIVTNRVHDQAGNSVA